ncbi:hypothetical protein ACFPYI_01880 [Halomarina salina]|uniref:Uncharacterized protein n=1 Tax=Halomarina salina TaxID=1872699 RepID=A0ABD5RHY6_9EURY|nr:hypothetical protein [Halomarina salina]
MSDSDISNVPMTDDTTKTDDPTRTPDHVNGSGGENDLVSLEQTTIQRDEDGEIVPRREYVEELGGDAIAKPMTGALRERYIENKLNEGEDVTDRDLANIFNRCVVAPDLTNHPECPDDQVTEEFVKNGMTGAMQDAYFILVLRASGEEALADQIRATSRGELPTQVLQVIRENPEALEQFMDENDSE